MKNKFTSLLFLKCPRCRKGNLLLSHPYVLSQFNKVNEKCPCCNLNFKIEPGFFYGSMYVSYALGVAVCVAVYVLLQLVEWALSLFQMFILITGVFLVLAPYLGALSKAIWASFFIRFDLDISKKAKC